MQVKKGDEIHLKESNKKVAKRGLKGTLSCTLRHEIIHTSVWIYMTEISGQYFFLKLFIHLNSAMEWWFKSEYKSISTWAWKQPGAKLIFKEKETLFVGQDTLCQVAKYQYNYTNYKILWENKLMWKTLISNQKSYNLVHLIMIILNLQVRKYPTRWNNIYRSMAYSDITTYSVNTITTATIYIYTIKFIQIRTRMFQPYMLCPLISSNIPKEWKTICAMYSKTFMVNLEFSWKNKMPIYPYIYLYLIAVSYVSKVLPGTVKGRPHPLSSSHV